MRYSAACSIVLLTISTCSAGDPPDFRWSKEIQAKPHVEEELMGVPLDADIYAATGRQWEDLRIHDSDGKVVPYLLEKQTKKQTRTRRTTWTGRNVSAQPLKDVGLEIRVRLNDDDPQAAGITLMTPLKNFEQRVQVFGAVDGKADQPLVSDSVIFDYSQYMDVSRREIPLPVNTSRDFRIVVGALTADQESQLLALTRSLRGDKTNERHERTTIQRRPFRIDRIEFWAETSYLSPQETVTTEWPIAGITVTEDAEKQQTLVEVQTRREPLVKFTLQTSSRNFNRQATVQIPETTGVKTIWRDVGHDSVSQFKFRDLQEQKLQINFPEQRHETWRIVIDNHDSPPLQIDRVKAEGHRYQLVYLAAANETHQIYYGTADNQVHDPPQYDVAAINAVLQEGVVPVPATLGASVALAEVSATSLLQRINNPMILGVVICLLVALLAWALFQAGRRIDQLPPDETP